MLQQNNVNTIGVGLPTCPTTTKGSFKQGTGFLLELYLNGLSEEKTQERKKHNTMTYRMRKRKNESEETKSEKDIERPRGKKRTE
jgi:hypothetical protein